ncbi:MAG: hypothetical protein KA521_01480 [Crocinitomicaceae bacterium]|nr:hypothetical protein [Crocinitomicaceae bacterium]
MFARYFFLILGVISLGWIGFVSIDLIDRNETLSPENLFGKEDHKLIIINRFDEVNSIDSWIKIPLNIQRYYVNIQPNLIKGSNIILSEKRTHFLIESTNEWNDINVSKLVEAAGDKVISRSSNSIKTKQFNVEIYKNKAYFHTMKMATTRFKNWLTIDKKSSAAIIDFSRNSIKKTEYYLTKGNQFAYKARTISHLKCNQINDKELFSSILPLSFKNYHFYEKEYFKTLDKTFAKSVFSKWMDKGFVSINYKGNLVLVSDYKIGQNPIQNLEELTHSEGNTINDVGFFKGIKLAKKYPFNNGFYVFNLNDAVIISASKTACEDILALNKIGKTLATEQKMLQEIYGDLPRDITERYSFSNKKYTKSIYNNQLFETHLLKRKENNSVDTTRSISTQIPSISMAVQGQILDFKVLEGKGNVAVITNQNQFYYFSGGHLSWKKAISGTMFKEIVFSKELEAFVLTSDKAIHLIGKNGIELAKNTDDLTDKPAIQAGNAYTVKGQIQLIYPTKNGNLIVLNAQGKQAFRIKGLNDCTHPLLTWKSANKQLVAVQNGQQVKLIALDKKQQLRTIPVSTKAIARVVNNELMIFNIETNNLSIINQKGGIVNKSSLLNGQLFVSDSPKELTMSILQNSTIQGITVDGANSNRINCQVSSIDWVSYSSQNGKPIYAVVDGLDNNVIIYNKKGEICFKEQIEGSKKCILKQDGNQLIVSTIVDNFIVQYRINL